MKNELTNSEQAIYNLLVNEGLRNKDIAKKLGYTSRTVDNKVAIIKQKKGVTTLTELIIKHYKDIIERGILCPMITSR